VPLTITTAAVIGGQRTGRLGTLAVLVTCALLSAVCIEIARRPDLQKPDVRGVAKALGPPEVARAIVADQRTATVLALYLGDVHAARGATPIRELDLILEPGSTIVRPVPDGFRRIGTRRVDTFRIVRFSARNRLTVRPAILRRILATSGGASVLLARPRVRSSAWRARQDG
jgi:hypothetical protein